MLLGFLTSQGAAQDVPASAPDSILVLAPATFTSTTGEYIFIVASAPKEITDVKMVVNGGTELEPLRSEQGFLHFRAQLILGLNILDISGKMGEKLIKADSLGIFRTSKIGMRIRSPFPKYFFHIEEMESKCGQCHLTDNEAVSSTDIMALNSLCLKCHNPLVTEEYVHGPIAVGTCAVCHSFSSEPNKYQLNQDSFDLCLLCHSNKAEGLKTKQYTHGPLGAALCDICHEPHSSPNFSQLRQPSGEICMVCHKALEQIFESNMFLHKPFEKRDCTKCHDPHYSDETFLQKKKSDEVCLSCHDDIMERHDHPVGVIPRQELPFETNYGPEGELICVTCHNPHGATGESLLPKEGCFACHPV